MGFSSPTWTGLLPGPAGSTTDALKNGTAVQQQVRLANALRGVDINDPSSVDRGIGAAIQNGALDQATALSNLNFTRSLRAQLPALGTLAARYGTGNSSAAPTSAPAPTQAPTDTSQMQPGDVQHATDTMNMAADAANQLLKVPQENRQAAWGQMRQQFLDRGVPPEAVDAAAGDLSDAHLNDVASHYTAAASGMAPGGQMPDMHPTTYAWYKQAANDPQLAMTIAGYKAAGFDLTPFLDTATKLAMPDIQGQADATYAGPKAFGTTAGTNLANTNAATSPAPAPGAVRNADNTFGMQGGATAAITASEAAKGLGTEAATHGGRVLYDENRNPVVVPVQGAAPTAAAYQGSVSGAQAGATAAANAPYELVPNIVGPNNEPLYRTKADVAHGNIPSAGPTPAVAAAAQVSGQENAKQAMALQTRAAEVPARRAALANLSDLSDQFASGPQAPFWKTAGALAAEYGIHIPGAPSANATSAQEEFDKLSVGILAAQRAQMGLPVTDASSTMVAGATPNERLSPKGIKRVISVMQGNEDYLQAQNEAWQKWSKEGHGGETFGDFQAQFNRLFDPRVFQAQHMAPDQRAAVVKSMGADTFNRQEQAARRLGWLGLAQ